VISVLDIAILITSISIVKITIVTMSHGSDTISTHIVAFWNGSVEEVALVADTAIVAGDLDVVERSIAGDAG
jgi:hypothetical protein